MASVCIVGKKGSAAKLTIARETPITLYKKTKSPDAIVNYGLVGAALTRALPKNVLTGTPIINKYIGRSKYLSVKDAEQAGILVPESRLSLPASAKLSDWIEKKLHSYQGKGIQQARGRGKIASKYYQKMVKNRRFELRVHAFSWLPVDEWILHKRMGPSDQIAWNFHQGGHFQSVHYPDKYKVFKEAKDVAEKILKIRSMAFGAVDLIVDNDMQVFFIEINSSPGFTEFSAPIYIKAMTALTNLSKVQLRRIGNV